MTEFSTLLVTDNTNMQALKLTVKIAINYINNLVSKCNIINDFE